MAKSTSILNKRRNRRSAGGAFGLGTTTPDYAWDFVNNKARFAGVDKGVVTNTPGWTFTRASAGYAQTASGTLTYFPANLLTYSEDFGNAAWQKNAGATGSGNTITFVNNNSYVQQAIPTGTWTTGEVATVRFKASIPSGSTTMQVRIVDNSDGVPTHNTNIALTTTPTYFEINQTLGAGITAGPLGILFHGNSVITAGTVVTITELQLERAASASAYISTTSSATGLIRRTDKGVLIEGARTNLCLQSQDFTTTWTKSRTTVTADAAVAPDGTTTADKLVEDSSATATHRTQQGVTKAASAIQYTASIYLKAAERTFAQLTLTDATEDDGAQVFINLSDGTLSTPAARVGAGGGFTSISATTAALANGWYRVSLTATTDSDTTVRLWVHTATSLSNASYTGDGASGLYLWGAQLEAASFPSSYIVTTTASATRAADALNVTGVTGLPGPYSLFAQANLNNLVSGGNVFFGVSDGTINNGAAIYQVGGSYVVLNKTSGSNDAVVIPAGTATTGARLKLAGRIETNNINGRANGGALGTTDTSCTAQNVASIQFGNSSVNAVPIWGYLESAAIWNRALTDAELQAVTR